MILNNQKGLTMPLVLMVMLVISFLGAALWQYSVTDTKQVARDENSKQAYYLARSGADALAAYITSNPDLINMKNRVNQLVNRQSEPVTSLGNGSFVLEVSEDTSGSNRLILIKSTATVQGATATATISLKEVNYLEPSDEPFYFGLYSTGGISLKSGAVIDGLAAPKYVGAASTVSDARGGSLNPQIKVNLHYPLPQFPTDLGNSLGNVRASEGGVTQITGSHRYDTITVDGGTLIFNTNDENQVVRATNLRCINGGTMEIKGAGRLLLYVDQEFNIDGYDYVRPTSSKLIGKVVTELHNPNQLVVFVKGGSSDPVIFANLREFTGYIFAPATSFKINSLQTPSNLYGAVICGDGSEVLGTGYPSTIHYRAPSSELAAYITSLPKASGNSGTLYQKGMWQ